MNTKTQAPPGANITISPTFLHIYKLDLKLLKVKNFSYILSMPIKPQINDNGERLCLDCNNWFPETGEYWYLTKYRGERNVTGNYCRNCREAHYHPDGKHVPSTHKPYSYTSEEQKEKVESFLTSIGWKWNKKGNLWWKPGVKLLDGQFVDRLKVLGRAREKYPGGSYVDWIPDRNRPYRPQMTKNEKQWIINKHLEGYSYNWIARETRRSKSSISLIVNKYHKENEEKSGKRN